MNIFKAYFTYRDNVTIALELFVFVFAIILTITHAILKRKSKNIKIWRILCCIPLFLCVVHCLIFHFSGLNELTLLLYGATYIEALLLAIWQFLYRKKHVYRIYAVFVNIIAVTAISFSILVSGVYPSVGNFTQKNYKDAFLSTVERMKSEYVLSDWKEINYDALQKKILPMIEDAQNNNDETAYYIALLNYCYYFYDGHVNVDSVNEVGEACINSAKERLAGNDYGFSMFTLDSSGETTAILVDENSGAYKAGIRLGTKITKWNDIPINEAINKIECIYPALSFPVKDNENYLKPMFLAGKGGESVNVSFIDQDSKEKTITLTAQGTYNERLDKAIKLFYHKPEDPLSDNFLCKMLSKDCGYLKVCSEISYDLYSLFTGDYTQIYEMLDSKIEKLYNDGMTKLIIDLRNNVGGLDIISENIVSMFSDKKLFGHGDGEYIDGKYVVNDIHYIEGKGKWSNIEVVALVNSECGSAGDHLAYNFSKLPNVTIMGITTSQGIDQSTGGTCVLTNGLFAMNYPIGLIIDENNLPLIDTTAERTARINLDEHIKMNDEAVKSIFSNIANDYELKYALNFLENK